MNTFHDKSKKEILEYFNTQETGLTSVEANDRLFKNGANVLDTGKKKNPFVRFLMQFVDVMILILLVAAVVSLVVSIVQKSSSELIDAIIIFGIVLLNAIIGFVQEMKAEKSLEALKRMSSPMSKVIRDGKHLEIPTADVVVGDVVVLEAGDVVPADLYLIEAVSLKCDESMLTGESEASEKVCDKKFKESTPLGDRKNICFSSSTVVYGKGMGIVVATGQNAEIGKIANMLKEGKEESTPLQHSLNKLGKILTIVVLAIAVAIFIVNIIVNPGSILNSFMIAVALAVGAIPEGLPAVVTIIMSLGVTRLAKKNAIVRKLHSVETLGCCEVICSDKTGTITQNKMTVKEIYYNNNVYVSTDAMLDCIEKRLLVQDMLLCNDAVSEDGRYLGDPTETALLAFSEPFLGSKNNYELDNPKIMEFPFDSVRKLMTSVNRVGDKVVAFTKGAVDMLLGKCTKISDNGKVRAITEEDVKAIEKANREMGRKALRVLGYAYKEVSVQEDEGQVTGINIKEEDLVFIGLSGMIDPPRDEVKAAVSKCKRAGMRAIMITGDHKDTAFAIASEVGIVKSIDEVIEGKDIELMNDKQLSKAVEKYSVYVRVSPEHKVRIVQAFKEKGKVVAMTGDGVNDAPSIKRANIGIGMGITGTEVTKQVADLILTDDNFATIVVAVEEGRKIFNNIRKTVQFLLSSNIAEVLSVFIITLAFPGLTFLMPVQLLFINLISDSLPAIALGVESADKDIMDRKPRNAKDSILSGRTGLSLLLQGLFNTVFCISAYLIGYFAFSSYEIAITMSFLTLNLIQLFHMFNLRTDGSVFTSNPFKNIMLIISFIVGVALTVLVCTVPFLESVFHIVNLTIVQWAIVLGLSIAIIPACEILKGILRLLDRKKNKAVQQNIEK